MAKNWRNSGFVAKFLTKFALFDERKMAFLATKNRLEPIYWFVHCSVCLLV